MEELKPCPFCGNANIKTEYESYGIPNPYGRFLIFCDKCGKPFIYVGDIPDGGWKVGHEPYCTCGTHVCSKCGSRVKGGEK